MTRYRPFSNADVRGFLEGKEVFRVPVKLKYIECPASIHPDGSGKGWIAWYPRPVSAEDTVKAYPGNEGFPAPYQLGDIIGVRETWQHWLNDRGDPSGVYFYKANDDGRNGIGWRSPVTMPREAVRIFLKVTGISCVKIDGVWMWEAKVKREG